MNTLLNKLRYLAVVVTAFALLGATEPKNEQEVSHTSVEKVSAHLVSLPLWWEDARLEKPEDRKERLDIVADTQLDVAYELTCTGVYDTPECEPQFHSDYRKLVGLIITAGFWETRYARRIQLGDCKKKGEKMPLGGVASRNECDSGRARSVYQVQKNGAYPEELWDNALGLDWQSHRDAAMAAGLTFSHAWKKCYGNHGDYGVWGAYAIGKCATVEKGVARARSYRKRMVILYRVLPEMRRQNRNPS